MYGFIYIWMYAFTNTFVVVSVLQHDQEIGGIPAGVWQTAISGEDGRGLLLYISLLQENSKGLLGEITRASLATDASQITENGSSWQLIPS